MALVNCPNCGKLCSNNAPSCLHCGHLTEYEDQDDIMDFIAISTEKAPQQPKAVETEKPTTSSSKLWIWVLMILAVLSASLYYFYMNKLG